MMPALRLLLLALVFTIAGCATVRTSVVQLNPANQYSPTQNVEVLLEKPQRPYVEIALLDSRGDIGVSEVDLLNDAREKAKTLGADAVIKLETERVFHEPVAVYDPFYFGPYRPYWGPLPPYPGPWGPYQLMPGGYSYNIKSVAIKYRDAPNQPGGK